MIPLTIVRMMIGVMENETMITWEETHGDWKYYSIGVRKGGVFRKSLIDDRKEKITDNHWSSGFFYDDHLYFTDKGWFQVYSYDIQNGTLLEIANANGRLKLANKNWIYYARYNKTDTIGLARFNTESGLIEQLFDGDLSYFDVDGSVIKFFNYDDHKKYEFDTDTLSIKVQE